GNTYSKLNNYKKSLQFYNLAVKSNNKSYYAYQERGRFYQRKIKDYGKALEDYNTSISLLDNKDRGPYYYRASLFNEMGMPKQAIDDCKKTIALNFLDPEGYYRLAEIHEKQSSFIKSIINISASIYFFEGMDKGEYFINDDQNKPLNLIDLYIYRGNLYNNINEKKSMCDDYNYALNLTKEPEKKKEIKILISQNCNQ
ncbi:hypothetical protein N9I41_01945, partial [Flavobacteriaceae bacterium]|nr:hypothetical protein [Flavobacteriaceae bacterium]